MEINDFLDYIDLTQYEKQVYLSLLSLGRSKSRKISKDSKVSYGRIYEILEKLEKRGLIQSIPTIPRTFEATDPKIAFNLILRKKTDEISEFRSKIKKINIKVPKESGIPDKTMVIHGKTKQLSQYREMDARAKNESLAVPGVWHPKVASDINSERILARGVKVKRIVRKITLHNKERAKKRIEMGEEIRQNVLMGLRLHVVDRKEAIISIVDPNTKDRISIYTSNKDFANSMAIFFDSLWGKSKNIKL